MPGVAEAEGGVVGGLDVSPFAAVRAASALRNQAVQPGEVPAAESGLACGSCGRPASVQTKAGLWRCRPCYEDLFIVCAWPRVEAAPSEAYVPPERPWLKWLPTPDQYEDYGWYR